MWCCGKQQPMLGNDMNTHCSKTICTHDLHPIAMSLKSVASLTHHRIKVDTPLQLTFERQSAGDVSLRKEDGACLPGRGWCHALEGGGVLSRNRCLYSRQQVGQSSKQSYLPSTQRSCIHLREEGSVLKAGGRCGVEAWG